MMNNPSREDKPGYWKRLKFNERTNKSDVWIPNDARRRPIKNHEDDDRVQGITHDLGVSEFYACLACIQYGDGAPVLTDWVRSNELYMPNASASALRFDAAGILLKHKFKYERECGNHRIVAAGKEDVKDYKKSLNHKLDVYNGYLRNHPDETLLVDFEVCYGDDYDDKETEEWVADTAKLMARFKLGNRMLVASHRDLVGDKDHTENEIHNELLGDPLGKYWKSPDGYVALTDIWK